jgi:hypothetical protein
MACGTLRADDPDLAADHLGALLEAEILEPLLLHVREGPPAAEEIALAVQRAVAAFLRAYSHAGQDRAVSRRRPKRCVPGNLGRAATAEKERADA